MYLLVAAGLSFLIYACYLTVECLMANLFSSAYSLVLTFLLFFLKNANVCERISYETCRPTLIGYNPIRDIFTKVISRH